MEKRSIVMQLLGCLMKNPLFLGEANTYCLTPNDFSRPLDKQIFTLFNPSLSNIRLASLER
jgi:hypothetical protein